MKLATCTYLIRGDKVLMAFQQSTIIGLKGYGGKKEFPWLTLPGSAVDEIAEETGWKDPIDPTNKKWITVQPEDLEPTALIDFYNGPKDKVPDGDPSFRVLFYRCFTFSGEAVSTKEMMDPGWYDIDNLPYEKLVHGDELFIDRFLSGANFRMKIRRTEDFRSIVSYSMERWIPNHMAA